MKTVAIIQARLTSKRFPNKIMARIGDKSILQHVIDNVKQVKLVHEVVVASPHPLEFTGAKTFVWNGNENNVLGRFYHCATQYKADTIVRITGDCPLIQPNLIDSAIAYYSATNTSYCIFAPVSGLDVEVFSYRLLEEAFNTTKDREDLEHVTPYMKRVSSISVDTKEDYERVKKLYDNSRSTSKDILRKTA